MPQPGWYPDPSAVGPLRFWDGTSWTGQIRPLPPGSVEGQDPRPGWYVDPAVVVAADRRLRLWDGTQWCDRTRPAPIPRTLRSSADLVDERRSWLQTCAAIGLVAVVIAVAGMAGRPGGSGAVALADAPGGRSSTYVDVGQGATIALEGPPTTLASTPTIAATTTTTAATTTTSTAATTTTTAAARAPVALPAEPPSAVPAHSASVLAPLVATRAVRSPAGRASDFSLTGYRWNACRTITVSSSGPDVRSIVAELASVTGLHLRLVNGPADVVVFWGTIPIRNAVGQTELAADGAAIVRARVTIAPRGAPFLATLIRHEMGHALGLGHAERSDEVMYPLVKVGSPPDYQAGDLAGLRAVGAPPAGC